MLLQYVKARPLGSSSVRYTPVFVSGAWRNLYLVKMGAYTLGALTYIDKPFANLLGPMEEFRIALTQSRLEIPVEVCFIDCLCDRISHNRQ